MMKKSNMVAMMSFILVTCSCGTGNRLHKSNGTVPPRDSLLDKEGNKYPVKRLLDGNLWMTANLNVNIENTYCYENLKENCERYRRLYIWESANQGCQALGDGWRLPTAADYWHLIRSYGGDHADSNTARKSAFKALLYSGDSGYNALLGGGRAPDGQYARIDAHGFYWTATEGEPGTAFYFNFAKGSQAFYLQHDGQKKWAFSVRCVKSVGSSK